MPPCAGRIRNRGIIRVAGERTVKFLQGLVTADISKISQARPLVYGAFLNHRGRVEFDVFISKDPDEKDVFMIEVARNRLSALFSHLARYRLRSQVMIDDITDKSNVWVACGLTTTKDVSKNMWTDPRLAGFGLRGHLPEGHTPDIFSGTKFSSDATVDDSYASWRTVQGVPESTDFENNPLPLEMGIDLLNGVAFDKGCYLGQELTARTHFTGVIRKRVTPFVYLERDEAEASRYLEVVLQNEKNNNALLDEILKSSKMAVAKAGDKLFSKAGSRAVGTVTSSIGNLGLAMLRSDEIFPALEMERPGIHKRVGLPLHIADGKTVLPWRPVWWSS